MVAEISFFLLSLSHEREYLEICSVKRKKGFYFSIGLYSA